MYQFRPSLGSSEVRARPTAAYRRGQILVIVAMLMAVLVGFVALATDVGLLWSERRQMQTATDAAAIAAATALRSAASISSAARNVASINGFTNGTNSATVTVNNPPASGNFAGNSNYVEVIIAQPETTYFLRVLGYNSLTVSARAVSGISNSAGCIYALDPSAQNALSASNGVNITSTCGIYVDSNNSQALDVIGGAIIKTTGVGVVGSAAVNNGGSIENLSGGSLTVSQNIAPLPDPLAHISKPSVGSCTYTGTQNYNSYTANQSPPYSGKYVIYPGVYCGGINASNGTSVTFSSGTYILAGGGMSLTNGGGTTTGSNVTFYNTIGSKAGYSGSNSSYAGINIANGVTANFSAPTTGGLNSLEGILFIQDSSIPAGSAASYFAGGASLTLAGALYFPTTQLNYSNGISAAYTILVADTIIFTGGATMNNNYASLTNGSPIQSSSLYE
jgi:Flp pilus assembly protein TadG